ncbi:MAG: hypothetical protein J0I47_06195 [Sphingomonas sp.]|uniref:hypothetical protein n=1 Tax=Sphingomonas sp. TaxID=28214 RepID=UPI001AC0B6B2|nr:hypothetical protein [Sphingomonas sp.]MBN8807810.1 hypothetical protein [Sphingomonas sp.]
MAEKHSRRQLRALRAAQRSICAGCGKPVPSFRKVHYNDPAYPTFDHLELRSLGGLRHLSNGLLKHRACNVGRGTAPPTGCDLIWSSVVAVALEKRPRSYKPFFKGGIRNPQFLGR